MECVKNSYSPCFFCDEIGENNSSIRLSLSKIFNYLQLFPRGGKGNKLNYPSDEKFSSVSICQNCSEMAVEFTELYHLLEVTELRLNRCLDRMQEVMTRAEYGDTLKPNDLRTVTIERINEISKLPHVALRSRRRIVSTSTSPDAMDECYSTGKDSNDMELLSPTPHKKFHVEEKIECKEEKPELLPETGCGREQVKRKRDKKHKKTRTSTKTGSLNSKNICIADSSPSSQSMSSKTCKFCSKSFLRSSTARRHMKYHCKKGPRLAHPEDALKLTCTYCSYQCPNRQNRMKDHLVRLHPEMFFQSERNNSSSSWKQEHFKSIVKEIALPNFILRNNGSSVSVSCSCSLCGTICETRKIFSENCSVMRGHLINNHFQEVREHLRDIMEESDASLQEKWYLALGNPKPELNISKDEGHKQPSSEVESLMDVEESHSDQSD